MKIAESSGPIVCTKVDDEDFGRAGADRAFLLEFLAAHFEVELEWVAVPGGAGRAGHPTSSAGGKSRPRRPREVAMPILRGTVPELAAARRAYAELRRVFRAAWLAYRRRSIAPCGAGDCRSFYAGLRAGFAEVAGAEGRASPEGLGPGLAELARRLLAGMPPSRRPSQGYFASPAEPISAYDDGVRDGRKAGRGEVP